MNSTEKVYVAGHLGVVGDAIVRTLVAQGQPASHIVAGKTSGEPALEQQAAVRSFFDKVKPQQVYLGTPHFGPLRSHGRHSADIVYDHLMVQTNALAAAFRSGVKKLLFIGARFSPLHTPIQFQSEAGLLSGLIPGRNDGPSDLIRNAGIKLCASYNRQYGRSHGVDYRSVRPSLVYGPGSAPRPETSPMVPALIQRFRQAVLLGEPCVSLPCSGATRYELLHVDDLAAASVHVMHLPLAEYQACSDLLLHQVNVATGLDTRFAELAQAIASAVGYRGQVRFELGAADSTPHKPADSARLRALGWSPRVPLQHGLLAACNDHPSRFA